MIDWIDVLMIRLVPRDHNARGHGEVGQGQLEEGQQGPGEGAKIFEDLCAESRGITWNRRLGNLRITMIYHDLTV